MAKSLAKDRFSQLVDDISRFYSDARRAQVKFAWETGRRIVEEEQDGFLRATYGANLLQQLSETLTKKCGPGFSLTNLLRMRKFYLVHPKQPALAVLDWGQQIELLSIADTRLKQRLEKKVRDQALTSRQVRELVRQHRHQHHKQSGIGSEDAPLSPDLSVIPKLKPPSNLRFDTFLLNDPELKNDDGKFLVDCGFSVLWPITSKELKQIYRTPAPAYTYRALVERVVDGDTLLVRVSVGFGIVFRTRLRLRGLDCPELATSAGKKARDFVAQLLPLNTLIALKSRKSGIDMYGRYVVDVFYGVDFSQSDRVPVEAIYLNQQLLDQKLAVRMD